MTITIAAAHAADAEAAELNAQPATPDDAPNIVQIFDEAGDVPV